METHTFNQFEKRFEPKIKKCSYCKTGGQNSKMEDNCFYSLYNIKDRTNLVVFRNVKFNEVKIGIPRCEGCRKVHSNIKTAVYIILFLGIPFGLFLVVYVSFKFSLGIIGMIILMALIFGTVYLSMVGIEKIILNNSNIKSEKDGALMEPLVKSFVRSGWSTDRPQA